MRTNVLIGERTYSVSTDGEIHRSRGKRLSKYLNKDGYEYVLISANGKRKKYLVHRLVATAFIPNEEMLPQVNHKDGNKRNNNIGNLEWVSNSENQLHSRYVLKNNTGFNDVPVICVESGNVYRSTRDAWRDTGACYSHISECIRGKRKTAGGYHWKEAVL